MTPHGKTRCVLGQSSWRLASRDVEAFVTRVGGHLGPVTFNRQRRKIQPFAVAPWAEEKLDPATPAILRVLRGDFFCLPFGGNATPWRGERHPVHGETANAKWKFVTLQDGCLHLRLTTRIRPGTVDKRILLRDGHDAVYCQHRIAGMRGPMNLGHHAMLRFPDEPGSGVISTSRFVYGQVLPELFERPENGGYCALLPGAEFETLERVPLLAGGRTDVSRYPARRGFEDLVMLVSDGRLPFAWTAVTFPKRRYVWFALKDPRVLRETVLWISNGGRYYPPWSGRHVNVMGLEEVTGNFHLGLAASVQKNPIAAKGYPTCLQLKPESPVTVNYIMATANVPAGFDRVAAIETNLEGSAVTLRSVSGKAVTRALDVSFLQLRSTAR
jgi:hypothetical protein